MTKAEALEILDTIPTIGEQVDALEMAIEALQQESIKFYYVESIDDYWIGQRNDNFYYANWNSKLGFIWSASRYLPWGEHIVDENTLWKEHTYPSEPKEIPFVEWIIGFTKKYFQQEPKWIPVTERLPIQEGEYLVTVNNIGGRPYRSIVRWANNLYEVDKYDFPKSKRKGWYYYDFEWGYCEETEVIAWQSLPEPYEERDEE